MPKRKGGSADHAAHWAVLTTSVEVRLQGVDAPIMRQLKEVVLLIKGSMPLGGILSAMLYMISTTERWRNLRFVEPGDRLDRERIPFDQFFVIARSPHVPPIPPPPCTTHVHMFVPPPATPNPHHQHHRPLT